MSRVATKSSSEDGRNSALIDLDIPVAEQAAYRRSSDIQDAGKGIRV
jgi:hypothetical protein